MRNRYHRLVIVCLILALGFTVLSLLNVRPTTAAPPIAPVPIPARAGDGLVMTKTVGVGPNCATTGTLNATIGSNLTYCYTIANTSAISLVVYRAYDEDLGALQFSSFITPGATIFFTRTGQITTTTTATATAYAYPSNNAAATHVIDDSNDPGGPAYNFIDLHEFGIPLLLADDGEVNIPAPNLTLWGLANSELRVANNGGVFFGSTLGELPSSNTALPDPAMPLNAFLPFWDDLDEELGVVQYWVYGQSPNRLFVIQWDNRPHFPGSGTSNPGTFQMQIDEGRQEVHYLYKDLDFGDGTVNNGASATVGYQYTTNLAVQYSYNQAVLSNNFAIRLRQVRLQEIVASDSTTVNIVPAALSVSKTVGTVPGACAPTDTITVMTGTVVYYCYSVTNDSTVGYPLHTLTDTVYGTIFSGTAAFLAPGATVNSVDLGYVVSDTITQTTVNTATWSARSNRLYYFLDDSLDTGGPTYNFIDISGTGTPLNLTEDGEVEIPISPSYVIFDFGNSSFNVGNNGVVAMGSLGEIGYYNHPLPDTSGGFPSNSLAAYWDDFDATGGNVYFQTFGTFPNRLFIVQWHNRPHVSNIGSATFQAQLDEAANTVTFMYQDVNFGDPTLNNGASATVGFHGSALFGAMYSFNNPAIASGSAVRVSKPFVAVSASDSATVKVGMPRLYLPLVYKER